MKVLVLTKDYPKLDGTHERMFVHVRNLYYKKKGIDVCVINFSTKEEYIIDGIRVISLKQYKKSPFSCDLVISHASNIKNNYRFLRKYSKKFPRIIYFFHGHEILYLRKSYPKPYSYNKNGFIKRSILQDIYDYSKIKIWRKFFKKYSDKSYFVFVSNWILIRFKENLKLDNDDLHNHIYVINNSIGSTFENKTWSFEKEKKYDFITIRSHYDGSTYCIDLLTELANKNPNLNFLLIGKGKYYEFNNKPNNISLINRTMDHSELLSYIDSSKCGLLLTRQDTQGVMTCELLSYGMPVITSDIDVCHEFFDNKENVALIDNNNMDIDIELVRKKLLNKHPYKKDKSFYSENTIEKEVSLFNKIEKGEC